MDKKAIKYAVIAILGVVIFAGCMYVGVSVHYWNRFGPGTMLGDLNVSGMTEEEANARLCADFDYKEIDVIDKNGDAYLISLDSIDYKADYSESVNAAYKQRRAFGWIKNYTDKATVLTAVPVCTYNEMLLENLLKAVPFLQGNNLYNTENTITIVRTEDSGYRIDDQTKDLVHFDRALAAVKSGIEEKASEVNLWDANCYESLDNGELENEVKTMYAKIEDFQSFRMTYDFGANEEYVDSSVTSG